MSGKRWIVVDTRVTRELSREARLGEKSAMRYYGQNGWARTIREAVAFGKKPPMSMFADWAALRRVVPAGTKRARAAAKAASSGREDSHSHEDLGFSVIPTAELLHGEATGSYSSCVPWEKIDEYATWLEERVGKGWREPSDAYDVAVRAMATAAVETWRKRRAK